MATITIIQQPAATTSIFDFDSTGNRRSACDRCRSSKLRCERDNAVQCRRCMKANIECVTGTALKSGRPLHLYKQQRLSARELNRGIGTDLSHQQALPDLLTPPSSTFNTPLEAERRGHDGDLSMQLPDLEGGFPVFDDLWANPFEQTETNPIFSQDTSMTASNPNSSTAYTRSSANPPSSSPEDTSRKLIDLCAEVLSDLQTVKQCRTVDKVPRAQLPSIADQSCNYLIGRMLDHSTSLLELLEHYALKKPAPRPNDQASGCSISRDLTCDVPTLFSLLSCNISLVRIYRTIFATLLDSLPFLSSISQPVPQLFPGMNLGGFKLESRADIQIQLLIQVSEDLMGKIEAKFGVIEDSPKSAGGQKMEARMLKMMLEEEAKEQPPLNPLRGECASLRDILRSLKSQLQSKSVIEEGGPRKIRQGLLVGLEERSDLSTFATP
jgi:Fungal Zn(2)-Cys(6) binuclear cluster domain